MKIQKENVLVRFDYKFPEDENIVRSSMEAYEVYKVVKHFLISIKLHKLA